MDIRGVAKTIYYPGPESQAPAVTVSLDGAAPSSVSGTQTTEYAAGQYKTALAAEQMDGDNVIVSIAFSGYLPFECVITTQIEEYASVSSITDLTESVDDVLAVVKGTGGVLKTIHLADSVTSADICNAKIWITNDATGHNTVVGTQITDSNGNATVLVDEGVTLYVWCDAIGYSFANPLTWEVE